MWTEGLLCWRWKGAGTPSGGGAAAGNGAAAVPVFGSGRCVCGLHGLSFISSEAVDTTLVEQVSVFPPGVLRDDYFK